MGLLLNYDVNTGIELDNMYFRIDKINFNDTHFQIVATGYASEKSYREGKNPISDPRAYTLANYDKNIIQQVFQFAYEILKRHPAFEESEDVLDEGQVIDDSLKQFDLVKDEHGNLTEKEQVSTEE